MPPQLWCQILIGSVLSRRREQLLGSTRHPAAYIVVLQPGRKPHTLHNGPGTLMLVLGVGSTVVLACPTAQFGRGTLRGGSAHPQLNPSHRLAGCMLHVPRRCQLAPPRTYCPLFSMAMLRGRLGITHQQS